jgi:hypothetical protein
VLFTKAMRTACAVLVLLGLAACDHLMLPRVPQVEQASEAVQGGDRYGAHRACSNASTSVDAMIGCMQDAGWAFVTRAPGYPEADCWQARDRGEMERVIAICFTRTGGPRTGAAP